MNRWNRTKQSGGKIPSQSDLRGKVPARTNYQKCNNKSKTKNLSIATWNVRTLHDSDTASHAQRRTAVIEEQLDRLNVDIAALSETHLLGEGSLIEQNYTFFWKGYPEDGRRMHGVGFAIKNEIVNSLQQLPHGISERLMTLKYQVANGNNVNIISAYAPTLDSDLEVKDLFYEELNNILERVPRKEHIILLGDFNARVGKADDIWPEVIGAHRIGKANSNGELLLELCTEQD